MKWKKLKPFIWMLTVTGVLLMFVPILFVQNWTGIDFTETGNIGETIGGTTAPFIGFLGVVLTFFAFWIQYEANQNQRDDISRERFESKFYEMLRLHRANVEDMEIDGPRGVFKNRKLLMRMFFEFKFIYYVFKLKSEELDQQIDEKRLLELSYRLFFHGLNEDASSSLNMTVEKGSYEDKLFLEVHRHLEDNVRANYISHKYNKDAKGDHEEEISLSDGTSFQCKFLYYPFDGHTNRLAHYYRHLYQMARLIIDENQIQLTPAERYGFIKMIRSQLSNYEQLLLYYNSFVYGKPWIEGGLFTDHRMIKNLPLRLADFAVRPHELFGIKNSEGSFIFEDDEYAEEG